MISGDFITRRRWILSALMLTMMLAAMDATIVSTAIPQIVGDLGGFSLFTWVFSIYLLMQTVTIPVYGKFADMFGRKPILVVGTVIFLVGSVASACSWNMISLIGFRALQGLGAGSIMATVNTIAGDLYSVRERARVQGWLSSVWGMAAVTGPAIGGAFAEYASWRWIFLINLPVGIIAMALLVMFLRERVERRRHRVDFAGAGLMFLAIGGLIFGLLQGGQAWPWFSVPSFATFAATLGLTGAAVWVEHCAAEPIMPGWLWRWRVLAGSNLAMICMGIVMMGPISYLPTFAQSVLGLGAIAAGFVLATMSIGWPLASALSGRVYLNAGFRDTALGGAVFMCAAALGFVFMPWPGSGWWAALDQFVLGAGFGLLSTPLLVGVQSVVGWQGRGIVTGANIFSRYLGQSIGAAIFGAVFNAELSARLASAPASLQPQLPHDINTVIGVLHNAALGTAADEYLRRAIYAATHHIYMGIVAVSILTFLVLLIAPRHFPIVSDDNIVPGGPARE